MEFFGASWLLGSHIGPILGPIVWLMLKLSWAMVGIVEAICQMLFGYVVGFVSQNVVPPEAPRF